MAPPHARAYNGPMPSRLTIAQLRERHRAEERRLVVAALERSDWRLRAAAADLGVRPSSLQRLISTHSLGDLYAQRSHSAGRPVEDDPEPS
jgi:transcriptional regulator with GAF, ATPase, and Fis domain